MGVQGGRRGCHLPIIQQAERARLPPPAHSGSLLRAPGAVPAPAVGVRGTGPRLARRWHPGRPEKPGNDPARPSQVRAGPDQPAVPFRHWDLAGVWGGGDGASPQRPVSVSAEDMAGLGEQEGRGGGPLPRKTAFPSAGRRRAKDRWMPAREMSPPPAARAQAPRAAAFLAAPRFLWPAFRGHHPRAQRPGHRRRQRMRGPSDTRTCAVRNLLPNHARRPAPHRGARLVSVAARPDFLI